MKKLTMTFVMILSAFLAYSQAEVAVGLKAGPNFAKINAESSAGETYKSRTGFHGGAFVLFKLTKIGIQPELLFSQQGTTVKFNNQDYDANYSYFNIPIILKVYTVAGINLQAGPQFGFVTKAEQEVTNLAGAKTTQDVKDQLKGSDIGLALGVGWDLPFGLTIDGRYNLGLSKINDSAGSPEAKNQVIQVSLGYKIFQFGK